MANVHVVTESLACLPREAEVNYPIRSLVHRVEGPDGPLMLDALLRRLDEAGDGGIGVARPEAADFARVFDELLGWGVEIVSIHPPTGFGGRADAAEAAARAAGAGVPITVVRTECAGPALGLVALAAAVAGDSAEREAVAAVARSVAEGMRQVLVSTAPAHLIRRGHVLVEGEGEGGGGGGADDAGGRAGASVNVNVDGGGGWGGGSGKGMGKGRGDDEGEAIVLELAGGALRAIDAAGSAGDALRMAYERIGEGAGELGGLHLALASAGSDAEVAALATVLGTRLFPDETWIGECDPALALELGPRSYAVAAWEGSPFAGG